jgi:hypothetical protein
MVRDNDVVLIVLAAANTPHGCPGQADGTYLIVVTRLIDPSAHTCQSWLHARALLHLSQRVHLSTSPSRLPALRRFCFAFPPRRPAPPSIAVAPAPAIVPAVAVAVAVGIANPDPARRAQKRRHIQRPPRRMRQLHERHPPGGVSDQCGRRSVLEDEGDVHQGEHGESERRAGALDVGWWGLEGSRLDRRGVIWWRITLECCWSPKTRSARSVGDPGYPREADRTLVIRLEDMIDAVRPYQPGESGTIRRTGMRIGSHTPHTARPV